MAQTLTLNVSLDPTLLETRSRVLNSGGYIAVSAVSIKEAKKKFLEGDFDIVLLCHSIPGADRAFLTELMHEHSPFTPVVLVSTTGIERDVGSVDAAIGNDPELLLQEMAEVLRQGRKRLLAQRRSA